MNAPQPSAEQLRIARLEALIEQHRADALRWADRAGIAGIVCAAALGLHLLAKCGPTLLPWLFS